MGYGVFDYGYKRGRECDQRVDSFPRFLCSLSSSSCFVAGLLSSDSIFLFHQNYLLSQSRLSKAVTKDEGFPNRCCSRLHLVHLDGLCCPCQRSRCELKSFRMFLDWHFLSKTEGQIWDLERYPGSASCWLPFPSLSLHFTLFKHFKTRDLDGCE